MRLDLVNGDTVQICLPEQADNTAMDSALYGRIMNAAREALSITVFDPALLGTEALSRASQFIVRKVTPSGLMEFGAEGQIRREYHKLTLTGRLTGSQRIVQRRDSCRIELSTPARYCDLAAFNNGRPVWCGAELRDVSLSGASLLLQNNNQLESNSRLLVEFALEEEKFSAPARVVRLSEEDSQSDTRLGLEFLEMNMRQQDRLARCIIHLQLRLISSRAKNDN
jgi:c-di-GMP-binding flagellar brake protein YcgR